MIHVQVDRASGKIVARGFFPDGSPNPQSIEVVELTDDRRAELDQPGEKTLNADGSITVTPPDPIAPRKNTPADKLDQLEAPRVITGSRTTDKDAILAAILRACAEAGFIIDQTRS
jgi:hypothetical protein